MVRHVVLLKFAETLPAGQLERIATALRALAGSLDAVRSYECGPAANLDGTNWHFAIAATFADEAGWRSYDQAPRHNEIRQDLIRPWLADRASVQLVIA